MTEQMGVTETAHGVVEVATVDVEDIEEEDFKAEVEAAEEDMVVVDGSLRYLYQDFVKISVALGMGKTNELQVFSIYANSLSYPLDVTQNLRDCGLVY